MPDRRKNISSKNIYTPPSVDFGWVRYPVGSVFGPRLQPDIQLFLLLEGSVGIRLDERVVFLRPGDCTVLLPGVEEVFRFSSEKETVHSWSSLRTKGLPESLRTGIPRRPCVQPAPVELAGLIETGVKLRRQPGLNPDVLIHLARCAFSLVQSDSGNRAGNKIGLPEPVTRAIRWIESYFDGDEIRSENLAYAAAVSPQHLSRLFRQHLGLTPMQYLWEVRIREGMEILRSTGLNVGEVAYRCGFRNPYHFSRKFHEYVGCPPTEYRKHSQQSTRGH
jgi:AraC family transcriptional regulator of arabinose operon